MSSNDFPVKILSKRLERFCSILRRLGCGQNAIGADILYVMGREEASIPGVIAAAAFAFIATSGYMLFPHGHETAWLCLFGCSIGSFFASFKPAQKETD
jgi:hypothetical protein